MDNTGDDFILAAVTDDDFPSLDLQSGGVITGGMIQDLGNGLTADGGTLNNVKYEGALNIGAGHSIYIDDDLTATGVNGTGAGTINIDDGILYLENTQTLNNATVNLTNSAQLQQYTTYAAYQANGTRPRPRPSRLAQLSSSIASRQPTTSTAADMVQALLSTTVR